MHGCGNDYVYVDCFTQIIQNPEKLAVSVSDRHKGVGGDGLVLICPSLVADAKMRMFNLDGSEGKMCGNAIRCVAKYLCDEGRVAGNELSVETLSGIKKISVKKVGGKVACATVDMGKGSVDPKSLPITSLSPVINEKHVFSGDEYAITCVSVGNPHCVIFVDDVSSFDVESVGKKIENDKFFPERVNVEFVKKTGKNSMDMRVWERGSGETLACGTGACASVYAGVVCGALSREEKITVKLLGGSLDVVCKNDDTLEMTGEAVKVFEGEYFYED